MFRFETTGQVGQLRYPLVDKVLVLLILRAEVGRRPPSNNGEGSEAGVRLLLRESRPAE